MLSGTLTPALSRDLAGEGAVNSQLFNSLALGERGRVRGILTN